MLTEYVDVLDGQVLDSAPGRRRRRQPIEPILGAISSRSGCRSKRPTASASFTAI